MAFRKSAYEDDFEKQVRQFEKEHAASAPAAAAAGMQTKHIFVIFSLIALCVFSSAIYSAFQRPVTAAPGSPDGHAEAALDAAENAELAKLQAGTHPLQKEDPTSAPVHLDGQPGGNGNPPPTEVPAHLVSVDSHLVPPPNDHHGDLFNDPIHSMTDSHDPAGAGAGATHPGLEPTHTPSGDGHAVGEKQVDGHTGDHGHADDYLGHFDDHGAHMDGGNHGMNHNDTAHHFDEHGHPIDDHAGHFDDHHIDEHGHMDGGDHGMNHTDTTRHFDEHGHPIDDHAGHFDDHGHVDEHDHGLADGGNGTHTLSNEEFAKVLHEHDEHVLNETHHGDDASHHGDDASHHADDKLHHDDAAHLGHDDPNHNETHHDDAAHHPEDEHHLHGDAHAADHDIHGLDHGLDHNQTHHDDAGHHADDEHHDMHDLDGTIHHDDAHHHDDGHHTDAAAEHMMMHDDVGLHVEGGGAPSSTPAPSASSSSAAPIDHAPTHLSRTDDPRLHLDLQLDGASGGENAHADAQNATAGEGAKAARTVILIRHAEKPADAADPNLSPQGYERATCIAPFFGAQAFGIQYLYAAQPCALYPSKRALETITPLSQTTGLNIDLSFIEDQEAELAQAIMTSTHQVTLVAWEHKKLTKVMTALGVANAPEYPGDHFDLIWTVPLDGSGTYSQSTQPAACTFPA